MRQDWLSLDDAALSAQCRLDAFRGSGPGGQHRNKASTAVRLTHRPSGQVAEASEERSQARNRDVALDRLRLRIALNCRAEVPTEGVLLDRWRRGDRLVVTSRADDTAALAELLDVLEFARWSVGDAAKLIGVSTANVVSVLQRRDEAIAHVNRERAALGLKSLGGRG